MIGQSSNRTWKRLTRQARVRAFNICLLISLLLSGMGLGGCNILDPVKDPIKEAVAVIDNGIRDIQQNSVMWSSILQRVANQLPREVSETIRVDAQTLANRSIQTAGVEFRCDVDFLGNRAIQGLQRLKAELLNQSVPPVTPAFCVLDFPSIDLQVDPSSWSTVILSGYDLDVKDRTNSLLTILLLTQQGTTIPLPEAQIGRTTHYQVALNLGGMASQFYSNHVVKLLVSWNGSNEGYPQIIVIPWQPQQVTETVMIGTTGPYYPPNTHGDGDFDTDDGNATSLVLEGQMQKTDQYLQNRMHMYAREPGGDNTAVDGWSAWSRAYTAPQGWRIVEVRPSNNSYLTAQVTVHDRLTYSRPAGEIVDFFEAWVDREGDEAGTWTRVIAHWRPLEITREEVVPAWLR